METQAAKTECTEETQSNEGREKVWRECFFCHIWLWRGERKHSGVEGTGGIREGQGTMPMNPAALAKGLVTQPNDFSVRSWSGLGCGMAQMARGD